MFRVNCGSLILIEGVRHPGLISLIFLSTPQRSWWIVAVSYLESSPRVSSSGKFEAREFVGVARS